VLIASVILWSNGLQDLASGDIDHRIRLR